MERLGARLDRGTNKSKYEGLMLLTCREQQVLEMMCEGMSNEEIATSLNIQAVTVKFYLKKVYDVFQTSRRHSVIIQAVKFGMVRPSWIAERNQSL